MLPSLLLRKILEEGLYTAYLKESSSHFMCNVVSKHAWDVSMKMDDQEKAKELREVGGKLCKEIQKMLDEYAIDPEWIGTTLAGAMRCRDQVKGKDDRLIQYSGACHNPKLRRRALRIWRDFANHLEGRGM
mgnify:FL=1